MFVTVKYLSRAFPSSEQELQLGDGLSPIVSELA